MKISSHVRRWLPILVLLATTAPFAFGQGAQVSGRVTDPAGGVIPGTDITVTNTETGTRRKVVTNEEGHYSIPLLQPGPYRMIAQKDGFKPISREQIKLQVGDNLKVDLQMEIGSISDQVTVSADPPLLRVDDVQSGQVIDHRSIEQLPQYNRNSLAFATMAAGVSGTSEQAGHGTDFRINGGRTAQTEYIIDGIPVTTGYLHDVPSSVPAPEAVEEFKVITNGLSAEYGRLSGGVIVLATRGGTNHFHGSGYDLFRNEALNAGRWNDNRFGRAKGAFHDNVFGGSFGGPVRIPKVYNGRDRTFFFFNYEGLRHSEGSNGAFASVPTELERNGDFSQSLVDQGQPVTIYDPTTGSLQDGHVIRSPFPGAKIPASRISPIAKTYSGYYPAPNHAPLPGSSHDSNYVGSSINTFRNNRWTGRLDENWSSNQMTHFSMTEYDGSDSSPRWFSPLQAVGDNFSSSKTMALDHVATLGAATVLNVKLGVVRTTAFSGSTIAADSGSWGFQNEIYSILGTGKGRAPNIPIAGDTIAGLGGGSGNDTRETNYTAAATLQRQVGKHSLKLGYEHRRYYTNMYDGGAFSMSSGRYVTRMDPSLADHSGSGYASFLLGNAIWGEGNQYAGPASLQAYHGAFLQNDIKLTPKLTINAGVRWDYEPGRTERFDRQIFWDSNYNWNWKPNPGWNWPSVLQQAGVTGSVAEPVWLSRGIRGRAAMLGTPEYPARSAQNTYLTHFSPHLGMAWQFLPRTVLRVSYGLNWMTNTGSWFLSSARWNNGYGDSVRLAQGGSVDSGLNYHLSFQNPMPGGAGYVRYTKDINQLNQQAMGTWYLAPAVDQYPGYEHAASFSIARELGSGPRSWLVEATFNANLGRKLPFWLGDGLHILPDAYHQLSALGYKLHAQVDNPFYGQMSSSGWISGPKTPLGRVLQVMPLWAEIWTMGQPFGTSNYTAATFQAEHRFSHGFTFMANYTFSRMLQDVGSNDQNFFDTNGYPQAGLGLSDVYGLAPTDMTHRLNLKYSIELPVGRGKPLLGTPQGFAAGVLDRVVGGWTLAGTSTFRSGTPLQINAGGDFWSSIGQGRDSLRAVFVNRDYAGNVDGHGALQGSAGATPYLNRGSFRHAVGPEIGDVPTTMSYFRGPGYSDWNLAIIKKFGLGAEARYLQLRLEAQNAFNHMNAANPETNLNSSSFGYITSQAGTPRRVIVQAKFNF